MEFRLTYQGELFSSQPTDTQSKVDRRAGHKHSIRRVFHKQLKRLWEITPFLKNGGGGGPVALVTGKGHSPVYDIASLAKRHALYGWNFVPLVTQDLDLLCGLEILFLRPDKPGKLWAGDIDNRIKTLFDTLRIPDAQENYSHKQRLDGENPFFCLLEKDELITKVSVETDQLLDFDERNEKIGDVKLVMTVRIRPYEMTLGNLEFG